MSAQGKFKKQLSLIDLTFIGLGAIFGSGWLFAASAASFGLGVVVATTVGTMMTTVATGVGMAVVTGTESS